MSTPVPQIAPDIRMNALASALRKQGVGILHQTANGKFDFAENLPTELATTPILGSIAARSLPPDIALLFNKAQAAAQSTGEIQIFEFDLGDGLRRRTIEAQLQIEQDGLLTFLVDVTEARAREVAVSSLLREVSHRSKNLLAIVQSVAMQTAHHSGNIQDFLDKFRGRLHALSGTQDLVTESNWRGTYLQSLVAAQLTRVGTNHLSHVKVTGENPLLGPNASLHVGLAIHELGTNAVSYGALAPDQPGQIWLDAHIIDEPDQEPSLVLEWQEAGTRARAAVGRPRFGTLVLERIVPLSVGGTAHLEISSEGVNYRLVMPADQFEV